MRGLVGTSAHAPRALAGGAFDPDKAYKDSKLCNVFFANELQRRLTAKGSKVECTSMNPGLITTSGFFRNQSPLFTKLFTFIVYNVARVARPTRAHSSKPRPLPLTTAPVLVKEAVLPIRSSARVPRPWVPAPTPHRAAAGGGDGAVWRRPARFHGHCARNGWQGRAILGKLQARAAHL